ncbi:MAG: hypothetical protein IJ143_10520 [Neisseriaceae bacterium]|nr:hypothetical protein [Neisseriaceae bacterium]
MKNFLQLIVLTTIIIVSLTACSEQQRSDIMRKIKEKQFENGIKKLPTHNEPMPKYPNLVPPSKFLTLDEINKNIWHINKQPVQNINRTIYFSKIEQENGERDLVQNREDSEYYRNIYSVTANGDCVVQDFYSENDQKQMELIIQKKTACESWKFQPYDGMAVWYDKDGKVQEDEPIIWFRQGKAIATLRENKENKFISFREEIQPNILRTTVLNQEIPPNGKRSPAWICELNIKDKKIEKFIQFSYEGIVEKYRFNDNNKIDATYLTIWTEDGSGFIGKVADKHVERMQKTVNIICGIE